MEKEGGRRIGKKGGCGKGSKGEREKDEKEKGVGMEG